jgi:hypothetical protein
MTAKVDDLLPTAKELLGQIALAEAENAAESMRKRAEAEAEKKRLLDTFSKPSLSDEEAIRQGIAIIQRAAKNGQTEVQVFPPTNCAPITGAPSIRRNPAGRAP